ncbi:MAG: methyltransferase [bacterium]|nr:methyltransferase [bacterium]
MSLSVHLRAFLKDPKGIAALTPTSAASVGRIASKAPSAEARLIVEFGPGSGVLTSALLDRLPPGARLLAIEANAEFAARLTARLRDPRLIVVHDSAVRVREILAELGLGPTDCVLSGIPFFWLSPESAHRIVANTEAALAPGGAFVTYQMFYLPRRRLRAHLERCFRSVRSELDLRNLPPQRIYEALK